MALSGDVSVTFTPELRALTIVATATALMWVPYVVGRMATFGVLAPIGNPGPGYPVDRPWMDRARRAHLNAIENLAVFAPLVLIAAIAGISTPATVIAAWTYVGARFVHYVIYAAGIPVIRTLAFLVGACATVTIGAVLVTVA
ncbi:MAPEG family protein [Lichenihabitans sp. PAMC28606]|uniref:MAPEG family protein n=1 Tax=Lichenihabitans sp. PAMC28606 TaxID=2880932 RepID=UPI001D0A1B46|nr:MAPEG family protein [Lichenihabitans sp. PAMC28606]UDL93735.1 MAPEG family protein [Lichenihabitans sp. PAMC28606]